MAKKKILIVEDEQVIQVLCRRLLGQGAYDLTVVGSVQEAMQILGRGTPDLLITDLRLPDGDGVEVIRRLRESSSGAAVIIITGSPTPEERLHKIEDLDVLEYINKPFEVELLLDSVKRVLEG